MANLAFFYNTSTGYYDIFGENGHLAKSTGLDSQLLSSILVDSRADDSEQPVKELQRGWAGNVVVYSNIPNYEMGCKQWLYIEQGKTSTENANAILDTVKNDGCQWFIDDGLAQDIELSINELNFLQGKISLDYSFKIEENNTEIKTIDLWNNTELN
jgi:hypothetical protein